MLLAFLCRLVTWWLRWVLEVKVCWQYLQVYVKLPGKWIFSTCFLKLPLSLPTLPQTVHRCDWGPSFTMYSYNCLSPVQGRDVTCSSYDSHWCGDSTSCGLWSFQSSICKYRWRIRWSECFRHASSYCHDQSQPFRTLYICDFWGHPSQYTHTVALNPPLQ